MDLNSIFGKNTSTKTTAQKGHAIVSNTMLTLNKEDTKAFKRCVYGKDENTLYIKLVDKNGKNEKSSAIEEDGGIRLNFSTGLGLEPKANKNLKLEPVKGQKNTFAIKFA